MPLIEVCVETLKDALTAQSGGANRIELYSHLEEDGLSPSNNRIKKV